MVSYLQLAHNERHPVSGNPAAKVIHNFGRADEVDRAGLARLVASISRFLTPNRPPPQPGAGSRCWTPAGWGGVDAGPAVGAARVGAAIRQVAAGRRLDGDAVERVVFALVAQRALEPGSKLTATMGRRAGGPRLPGRADRRSGLPGDGLPARRAQRDRRRDLSSVAHLLNLDLDIVFVDTTSTYWEVETADELAELAEDPADDETTNPTEARRDVRALQGPPRGPAPGGDRHGGHPRRHPGPVLDLPW